MKNKRSLTASLRRDGLAVLCAAGLFLLVYEIVFNFRQDITGSDFAPHISWAIQMSRSSMLSSFYNGQERLWHVCMRLVMALGVNNIRSAAAIVTAAADAAAYCIVYGAFARHTERALHRWVLAAALLCPFLVTSLTLPGHSFYTGRGAVSTWHNPTNIMVRPFAAAVFYMTVDIYSRRRYGQAGPLVPLDGEAKPFAFSGGFWRQFLQPVFTPWELVLYPVCILASLWAKPSFIQVFAPAIFLFLLIDVIRTKGKLLPFCIKMALAYLPAVLLLSRQFGRFFAAGVSIVPAVQQAASAAAQTPAASGGSGLSIYLVQGPWSGFGLVWDAVSYRLKTAALPCAFPLLLLLAAPRRTTRCASFRLGLVCAAVGLLEVLLLHETGSRSEHGNLNWGLYTACWMFWTAAMGQYVRLVREKTAAGRVVLLGGTALLVWQLVSGVLYIQRVLQSVGYHF